jgi:hypothetical protein
LSAAVLVAALVVAATMIPRRMRTAQAEVADAIDATSGNGSGDPDREMVP